MINNNNNQSSPVLARLRIWVDYLFILLSLFGFLLVSMFPVPESPIPAGTLPGLLFVMLLFHLYALRTQNQRMLVWIENGIFASSFFMWVLVWVNGELYSILLPGFVALAGIFSLNRPGFLISYAVGSTGILAAVMLLQPDLKIEILGRSGLTLVGVIGLLFYLLMQIRTLDAAERHKHEQAEQLRKAYAELDQKNRSVQLEIEKFDDVCDQLDMVYWRLELASNTLTYNRRFAERWGLEVGATLPFEELRGLMADEYVDRHKQSIREVVETRSPLSRLFNPTTGDRAGRNFNLRYWPSFDVSGQVSAVNLVNLEVTELIKTQEELERKNQELELRRQREKNMYAVIGHEIRTPATILKLQLEQQRRNLGVLDVKLFESSVDQLLTVLDTLRTVSRPDEIASADLTTGLLSELIANQIAMLESFAQESGVELHADYSGLNNRPIGMMAGPLKQVISNLVKNAIIHSGAEQVWLSATSELRTEGQKRIRLVVEDNGRGISQTQMKRLFEPYERGQTSASGTGLGLYICREIATLMDGTLEYRPSQTGGALFELEFSAELSPEVDDSLDASGDSEMDVAPNRLSKLSVLLVEDDPSILKMTAVLLSQQCAVLRVAKDGEQGLDILANSQVDLVLTDIFMPQMDGIEMVRQMRSRGHTHRVIGLTAATLGQETELILAAGANAVVNKPLNIPGLNRLLGELGE